MLNKVDYFIFPHINGIIDLFSKMPFIVLMLFTLQKKRDVCCNNNWNKLFQLWLGLNFIKVVLVFCLYNNEYNVTDVYCQYAYCGIIKICGGSISWYSWVSLEFISSMKTNYKRLGLPTETENWPIHEITFPRTRKQSTKIGPHKIKRFRSKRTFYFIIMIATNERKEKWMFLF